MSQVCGVYLCHLRDKEGLSAEEIVRKYVYITAGSCGPCRFGSYITEYRKALREAGFDGFRVLLFQQQDGLKQATGEAAALQLNPQFFVAILKAVKEVAPKAEDYFGPKIRYLNARRKSWSWNTRQNEPGSYAHVTNHGRWSRQPLEIAVLRPTKVEINALVALAEAAIDDGEIGRAHV